MDKDNQKIGFYTAVNVVRSFKTNTNDNKEGNDGSNNNNRLTIVLNVLLVGSLFVLFCLGIIAMILTTPEESGTVLFIKMLKL